ncbi:MAG: hypothetical protein IJ333_00255 [Clostridia bacterium]|nr:hypothetical protein [Clostridia bacterium]
MGILDAMRTFLIVCLILFFSAVTLWGIEAAASGTHLILGNAGHQSFIGGLL